MSELWFEIDASVASTEAAESRWTDTKDPFAQRGIAVTYEAIRQWCRRFGPTLDHQSPSEYPGSTDGFFFRHLAVTSPSDRSSR